MDDLCMEIICEFLVLLPTLSLVSLVFIFNDSHNDVSPAVPIFVSVIYCRLFHFINSVASFGLRQRFNCVSDTFAFSASLNVLIPAGPILLFTMCFE